MRTERLPSHVATTTHRRERAVSIACVFVSRLFYTLSQKPISREEKTAWNTHRTEDKMVEKEKKEYSSLAIEPDTHG